MNNEDKNSLINKYLEGNSEIEKPYLDYDDEDQIVVIDEPKSENILEKYLGSNTITEEKLEIQEEPIEENIPVIEVDTEIEINEQKTEEIFHNNEPTPIEVSEEPEVDVAIEPKTNEELETSQVIKEESVNTEHDSLQPIMLEENIELPEPANLDQIISELPENEVNLYEEINKINQEEIEKTINVLEEPVEEKDEKKPSKGKRMIVSILFVLILFVAVFLIVFYIFNSNYNKLLVKSLEHLSTYSEKFKLPIEIDFENQVSNGSLEIKSPNEELKFLTDLSMNYNFKQNEEDFEYNLILANKNQKKLNMELIVKDLKAYAFLEDIYEKYLLLGEFDISKNELEKEKIEYSIKKAYNVFVENINKDSYSSSNAKIKINDKEKSVRKTVLTLTPKERVKIINKVIDSLKTDVKTKELFKDVEKVKLDEDDTVILKYSVYTQGITHTLVGIDFETENTVIDYDKWFELECDFDDEDCKNNKPTKKEINKVEYRLNDIPTLLIYANGNIKSEFAIESKGNITTIKGIEKETEIKYTLIITKNKMNYEITFNMIQDEDEANINLDIDFKEVKKDEEYNIDFTLESKIKNSYDNQNIDFSLISKNNIKNKKENIKNPGTSVEFDDLTEEETTEMTNKFLIKLNDLIGFMNSEEIE